MHYFVKNNSTNQTLNILNNTSEVEKYIEKLEIKGYKIENIIVVMIEKVVVTSRW